MDRSLVYQREGEAVHLKCSKKKKKVELFTQCDVTRIVGFNLSHTHTLTQAFIHIYIWMCIDI